MTCETFKKHRVKNWRSTRNDYKYNDNRFFSLLEKMFWYYNPIKKALAEARAEFGYYRSGTGEVTSGSGGGGGVSNPTANVALKRITSIPKVVIEADSINEDVVVEPEKWVFVVEQTLRYFESNPVVKEVLMRRYLHNEPQPTTCIELGMASNGSKYYRVRDIGLRYARECAIQMGLIKVF